MPAELRIFIHREFQEQLTKFTRELDLAAQQPTASATLRQELRDAMDWSADRMISGLQSVHLRTPVFIGRSFRTIRKRAGGSKSFIGKWVSVGYYPMGAELGDTAYARGVQVYWGRAVGGTSVLGALLKGVPPGGIRAPRKGVSGKGTFGGGGWDRLEGWLTVRGLGGKAVYRRKPKKYGETEYKYPGMKQDIWAIVKSWEKKGMAMRPVIDWFYVEVLPRELELLKSDISRIFENWWESLGVK